ncbi:phage integrase Arm DNA-binding domain-containing protein [Flagellatimonas centrodinii]|uniref:phage integrase Arm DNA-binding domain-containing protein n=1 Tax=Flagellatimonas centrodinii TaxID=2806210 RepID=UPI001FEF4DA0|nr:phage integrase Arm DNA-binding domain-containing protein [Flagellatimonas centrodinii]ULQ45918.1 phage integrase Arm DNA-binding domain-containing protein [Flagellatimonas centrodinii]
MGRHRSTRARAGWPQGLRARERRGVTYYSYVDPVSGEEIGLGRDLAAALQAVRVAARRSAPDAVQVLVNRIDAPAETWREHMGWVFDEYLPTKKRKRSGQPLAKSTMDNYRVSARKAEIWNERDVASITRREVVDLLDEQPLRAAEVLRAHLALFFALAVSRGRRDANPAEGVILPDSEIQRVRLTYEAYDAVFAAAPGWLQRAMTLTLTSLQRPVDLTVLPRTSWDARAKRWAVRQLKSEAAGFGLLRIRPHVELRRAIEDCLAHQVEDCPFLLSYPPEKRKLGQREHAAQLSRPILSRAFAEVRERVVQAGAPPAVMESLSPAKGQASSFYEIKALGARRLEEKFGWPTAKVQALAGHQSPETTQIYTGRHREKWVEVLL